MRERCQVGAIDPNRLRRLGETPPVASANRRSASKNRKSNGRPSHNKLSSGRVWIFYSREDLIAHLEWLFSERIRLAKFFESKIEIADRQPIASFVCCSPQDEQF
jgi:hypothetical protein